MWTRHSSTRPSCSSHEEGQWQDAVRGACMLLLRVVRNILSHPLNRRRKGRALLSFLQWQVRSRLTRKAILCDWIEGSRLLVRRGDAGLTCNLYCGLFEFDDMAFLLHYLRPGDLFLDVGANAGSYTVLASGVVGAESIAFEPVPETFLRLKENVTVNGMDARVQCINVGIGEADGQMQFTIGGDATNHVLRADESPGVKSTVVEMRALDALVAGRVPALMKIDVEGFETAVIRGAGNTLDSPRLNAIIIERNQLASRYGFDENEVGVVLARKGFQPFRYTASSRTLEPLDGDANPSGNTLFVKDLGLVKARVAAARRFTVCGTTI